MLRTSMLNSLSGLSMSDTGKSKTTDESSSKVTAKSEATGASFTGITSIVKLCSTRYSWSLTLTLIIADPNQSEEGINVISVSLKDNEPSPDKRVASYAKSSPSTSLASIVNVILWSSLIS